MKPRSLHGRLTVNSLSNVARQLAFAVVGFLLTPYIVSTLGDNAFGIWVIVLSFVGYASIAEMGMHPAIVKLVAEFKAVEDARSLNHVIQSSLFLYLIMGGITGCIFVLLASGVLSFSILGSDAIDDVGLLSLILGADILVTFILYVFSAVLYGLQQYVAKNAIDIAQTLVTATLILLFLDRGGLLALALIKLSLDVGTLVVMAAMASAKLPEVRFFTFGVDKTTITRVIKFGGTVAGGATMVRLFDYTQPILIGHLLSPAWTTYYAIPKRLVGYAKEMTWAISAGFMPTLSELHSRGDRAEIRSIYLRYTRLICVVTFPAVIFLTILGPEFIANWLGAEYAERGANIIWLLSAALLLEGAQPLSWRLFIGIGDVKWPAIMNALSAALGLASAPLLGSRWGIEGVGMAVLLVSVIREPVYYRYVCAHVGISPRDLFLDVYLRPFLVAMFAAAALQALNWFAPPSSLIGVAGLFGLWLPLYAILAFRFCLEESELALLKGKLRHR